MQEKKKKKQYEECDRKMVDRQQSIVSQTYNK